MLFLVVKHMSLHPLHPILKKYFKSKRATTPSKTGNEGYTVKLYHLFVIDEYVVSYLKALVMTYLPLLSCWTSLASFDDSDLRGLNLQPVVYGIIEYLPAVRSQLTPYF